MHFTKRMRKLLSVVVGAIKNQKETVKTSDPCKGLGAAGQCPLSGINNAVREGGNPMSEKC